jgi:hypothetical protein
LAFSRQASRLVELALLGQLEGVPVHLPFTADLPQVDAKTCADVVGRAADGGLTEGRDPPRMVSVAHPQQNVEGFESSRHQHGSLSDANGLGLINE